METAGLRIECVARRTLMGKRASIIGTVLRARPPEGQAAAVIGFADAVVRSSPRGAWYRDRSHLPAEESEAAFERRAAPGKFGKVLLRFD